MRVRIDTPDADVLAARAGDRPALARVFASTERLCVFMARRRLRHLPPGMDIDEAVQVCRLAVMDAIRKYQPGKSTFGAYASIWMRARLTQAIEVEAAGVVPRVMDRTTWKLKAAGRAIPLDRGPSDEPAPIDALSDGAVPPDAQLAADQRRTLMRRAIGKLKNPRHRAVVWSRLEGRTLAEVGAELGVSRERVRQIEEEAHASLRRRMKPIVWEEAA